MIRPSRAGLSIMLAACTGCTGIQSALHPAGRQADDVARLYWWMAGASIVIWAAVIALAIWSVYGASGRTNRSRDRALIVGAGAVVPLIVLTALLAYGLRLIPPLVARAPDGALAVAVTGEQWWWRIRYADASGTAVEVANQIRLPVGEPVQFRLDSDNVIHSFWVPPLGGKMDMIPGRVTWLTLQADRPGRFRGACAEYCGSAHALMAFDVEAVTRDEFDRWLEQQARPATAPDEPLARQGQATFLSAGCGGCHTIRGTPAAGRIGPDLTHVGSRPTLAASTLPNTREALRRWIAEPGRFKPQARMPRFGMLPQDDLAALAAYLESLR